MPTNQNAYNSRVTSEALEKKFRDTFTAQGGAELVDDLYASGVVIPVVDFSDAASGSVLAQNLQTAYDFATISVTRFSIGTSLITSTPGFYTVSYFYNIFTGGAAGDASRLYIDDGTTGKTIYRVGQTSSANNAEELGQTDLICYLRSGDSLYVNTSISTHYVAVNVRQIADVSGNLINPLGFVSS